MRMATTAKNREDIEEAAEEVIASPGWRLRAKNALTRILLRELDRAIGVMQKARTAVAPADETSGETAVKAAPVAKRKVMRPLAIVMLSLLLLAIATAV